MSDYQINEPVEVTEFVGPRGTRSKYANLLMALDEQLVHLEPGKAIPVECEDQHAADSVAIACRHYYRRQGPPPGATGTIRVHRRGRTVYIELDQGGGAGSGPA